MQGKWEYVHPQGPVGEQGKSILDRSQVANHSRGPQIFTTEPEHIKASTLLLSRILDPHKFC